MTTVEQIRARITKAMKEKNPEKDILRVFLGKLQQIEADEGAAKLTDDRCAAVARSIIKGNKDAFTTVTQASRNAPDEEWKARLEAENKVMESFLPDYLDADEIAGLVMSHQDVLDAIRKANNEGQATGVAMKFFKSKDLKVEGNTVKEVAKQIWTSGSQRLVSRDILSER